MQLFEVTDTQGNTFGTWAADDKDKALDEIFEDIRHNPDWYQVIVERENLRAEVVLS